MDKKIIARVAELTKSDIVGEDVQAVLDELKRLETKLEACQIVSRVLAAKTKISTTELINMLKEAEKE